MIDKLDLQTLRARIDIVTWDPPHTLPRHIPLRGLEDHDS